MDNRANEDVFTYTELPSNGDQMEAGIWSLVLTHPGLDCLIEVDEFVMFPGEDLDLRRSEQNNYNEGKPRNNCGVLESNSGALQKRTCTQASTHSLSHFREFPRGFYDLIHSRYHCWMESEELRILTASERLTLEEEYLNQVSWMEDPNKCTFIILEKTKYDESLDEIVSMIGDVNLFLQLSSDDDPESGDGKLCQPVAEIEIMIAEDAARGKGLGKESLLAMIIFGRTILGINRFTAKIGFDNHASISLFRNVGFIEAC
ncbi:unnamed protein product [Notodromas monacha]|uniref:N-acetyltransferase domain-containing protein n=1 Tax=Notodromas monacha TaxID=399045 RepID=A0A7R9C017_9CRUS|nr:unnamed protein product [Notodromas monacha]CAG0924458.1 unnamed protein product [Notodromas monacha]